jgi:hypothetical protein
MSDSSGEIPTFEQLAADPEIAALLDFEPVPRNPNQPKAWTPELQRRFIAWLAVDGSKVHACAAVGKDRGGIDKLYQSPEGASFRAAWDAAVDLAERRKAERLAAAPPPAGRPPTIDNRFKRAAPPDPGQVVNEFGEWEDEGSYAQRVEESRDSVSDRLRRCRRLFLWDISNEPAKRAAFEILTGFPVDWDKAARMEPQADEPWRKPNMRSADILLTAENGWLGEFTHGPDQKAELLRDINAWRAERGEPPVAWKGEGGAE